MFDNARSWPVWLASLFLLVLPAAVPVGARAADEPRPPLDFVPPEP